MKITRLELKEMIREALREELNEGIFDKKLPAGTIKDCLYDAQGHILTAFVQPAKSNKLIKYEVPDVPVSIASKLHDPKNGQEVYDKELAGKYNYNRKETDFGNRKGWWGYINKL
jgi:hypothetical protein